jgi:hypothetical protein
MSRCRRTVSVTIVLAIAACAKPLPAPDLASVPAAVQHHPAVGVWHLRVERQDTSRRQPDVLPAEGRLLVTPEARSPVGHPLYLRATLESSQGDHRDFLWAPVPGTDSIEIMTIGGLELRLLVASDHLDGQIHLRCDLGLDCRAPYGVAYATRTGQKGS